MRSPCTSPLDPPLRLFLVCHRTVHIALCQTIHLRHTTSILGITTSFSACNVDKAPHSKAGMNGLSVNCSVIIVYFNRSRFVSICQALQTDIKSVVPMKLMPVSHSHYSFTDFQISSKFIPFYFADFG